MTQSVHDLLEQHFDTAFAAPGGIPKLRELILTLAMQGKLVEQNPNDPPASELLKEIEAEKQRLIADKKFKKPKSLPPIKPEEVSQQLPNGWAWVRLRDICHDWGQKTPDSMFTYIDVGSIDNKLGIITSNTQILDASDAPSRARKIVKPGTIIYSTVRPYLLNVAVVEQQYEPEPIASTAFAILHPFSSVIARFVYHYLRSPFFIRYVESTQKGVAYPAINDGDFFSGIFPLPPYLEQHRIVARIDQLMKRCDELEKLRKDREEKRLQVHAAAIKQLLNAPENAGWPFIQQHFGELYTVKENVAELRKAILQLAVMGRLVPQDPNDPPASELLKEIEAEKQRLISEKKIKKQKPLPPIKPEEIKHGLPSGWEWVRLGDIGNWKSGSTPSRSNPSYYGGDIPWVKSGEVKQRRIKTTEETITQVALEKCSLGLNPVGSVLVAMYGANIGEVGILEIEATTNQAVCACQTYAHFDENYLLYLITSMKPYFLSQGAGAAQPNISREKIIATVFPLPPLPEQRRIVVRIDQLMALCDKLDSQIDATTNKQKALLNAVMAQV